MSKCSLLGLALATAACSSHSAGAIDAGASVPDVSVPDTAGPDTPATTDEFSIVALPDTQYYNGSYAWVFQDQTAWIAAHAADSDKNIQLVVGLGDIVDGGGVPIGGACPTGALPDANWATQWSQASSAIDELDGHVPYLLATGNHDYDCEAARPQPRSITNWEQHFGPARYTGKPWWNGAFETGAHGNFYNVFTIHGTSYLVVALQFYPTNDDLAWANTVISDHASLQTIIITHAYMFYDTAGPGTATRVTTGDSDSAASYELSPSCTTGSTTCGNGNNGSDLWTKLVSQHRNIMLVLSGHFRLPSPGTTTPLNNGVGYRSEIGPLGNRINQVLSDYQGQGRNGYFGNGYLRLYTFKPSQGVIEVSTYSPPADMHPSLFPSPGAPPAYKTDAYNQFTLPYANPITAP